MADLTAIGGAISSLRLAGDLAKSFLDLKTAVEVQGKVIELQSVILAAQGSALSAQSVQSSMVDEIRTLKEEVARVKAWDETRQRYRLHEVQAGSFVYLLKEESAGTEPAHWICATCYENGFRSIFQKKYSSSGGDRYACPNCKNEIATPSTVTPHTPIVRRKPWNV